MPYNDANADYLYKIFGKDMVKVVEGAQAIPMTVTASPPDAAVSGPAMVKSVINEDGQKQEIVTTGLETGSDSAAELNTASDAVGEAREVAPTSSFMPVILVCVAVVAALGGIIIANIRSRVLEDKVHNVI